MTSSPDDIVSLLAELWARISDDPMPDLRESLSENEDFDSLALLAFAEAVEERLGVYISDEVLESIDTLGEFINATLELQRRKVEGDPQ